MHGVWVAVVFAVVASRPFTKCVWLLLVSPDCSPAQVYDQLKAVCAKFGMEHDVRLDLAVKALAQQCYTTLVTGLLLHAMATSTGKLDLRGKVLKHLAMLEQKPLPDVSRDKLPEVLRDRAEKALRYQLQVASAT